MNFNKIQDIVKNLTSQAANSEKIIIAGLRVKLENCSNARPQDQTLSIMTNVISKMDDNNKLSISRTEFKDMYKKLYVHGTKFAEFFKEELGEMEKMATATYAQQVEPMSQNASKNFMDPILLRGLASAFDKNIPFKKYSEDTSNAALKIVQSNLDSWNLKASKLSIEDGNEHFIVLSAHYDTPKGITSVFIPVEILRGKVSYPSLFMGNAGPKELNHINLKNYITSNAGIKLNVNANDIVSALSSSINKVGLSEVELALTKVRASQEMQSSFFGDKIVGLKMASKEEELDIPLPKMGHFNSFAEKFETALGQANFNFGVKSVNLGRDVIVRELENLGFKHSQISIASSNKNSITYAVSIPGKTAFTVPVKIANNKVYSPEILVCNGGTLPFNKDSFSKLFAQSAVDYKAAAVASPSYELKSSELIQSIASAMSEQNYAKAEDALTVLKTKDIKAYQNGFSIYMNGLSKKASVQEEQKCSLIIKSASSQHPICGHTNLPLHKVYQDKYGTCHPEYRKNMEDNFESIAFMNAKAFGFAK